MEGKNFNINSLTKLESFNQICTKFESGRPQSLQKISTPTKAENSKVDLQTKFEIKQEN
jgi:hypothetical protein